ncbi:MULTISPECIES: NTP transferase domain-containing protein [unclassified Rhizobium]|uniref:NTP transferase domain-containing protein n=1 Tax=unclassified Rhizobium TaxID=2613769 RepID=UPI0007161DA2|nr:MULTISPECIES: molybdopterin-binding/glycosyltransferase family 2 protein [unclassified Rhizobium]KQS98227.1 4-diphosphocytidyl-2C-methyl-D-erythritol kinase [Rhizobium sp. Leaf386]KQT00491.1 4-diphosphocytidyl-2C-methyl-D-erythritol kinase [Rhizobium sp. Leaf391]KQT97494.1 4-diphosphocytidyl-2C-methyl-D-erythritol kinase [Rhizobium sp. Leaf453]
MKFGPVAVAEAEGTVLAHSAKLLDGRLAKGHLLSAADLCALEAAGLTEVVVAQLEAGDLLEDEAAQRIADAINRDHFTFSAAATGRINIHAAADGLFVASRTVVDRLNRVDPAITLACLGDHVPVRAGDMVATIKIIPLAVAGEFVQQAAAVLRDEEAFRVKPFAAHRVALIATMLPSLKPSVMDKTRRILEDRLLLSASTLINEIRVAHTSEAVASAISGAEREADMIIVFGASAVADADDVIPASIRLAGGQVDHVGMPVDPGNLLVLGKVGEIPVIGAPGCARSPKENGFDWILDRILAGEWPSPEDITGLGVGGLLMEIPTRPLPRALTGFQEKSISVSIVLLAAGKASRMGQAGQHKLLAEFDGIPLIRRSAEAALGAKATRTIVVTGHRQDEIRAALSGLDVVTVENADYATGMASSLVHGLTSIAADVDGVLVMLADMPLVTAEDLRMLIEVFKAEHGQAIIRAVSGGKRGNPVILPRSTFEAVRQLQGDIGARHIIESSGLPVIDVEIGPAAHLDLDTPEAILAAGGILKG